MADKRHQKATMQHTATK